MSKVGVTRTQNMIDSIQALGLPQPQQIPETFRSQHQQETRVRLLSPHQHEILSLIIPVDKQAKSFERCLNYLTKFTIGIGTLFVGNFLLALREMYVSQDPELGPMMRFGSFCLVTSATSGFASLYHYHRLEKCLSEIDRLEHRFNLPEDPTLPVSPSPVSSTLAAITRRFLSDGRQELPV